MILEGHWLTKKYGLQIRDKVKIEYGRKNIIIKTGSEKMRHTYKDLLHHYTDEILEIIDSQDIFTRSDLQAVVEGIVNKILKSGGVKNND